LTKKHGSASLLYDGSYKIGEHMQILDTEQIAHIQAARVPVDNDMYPKNSWVVCLSIESEMPTDQELRQLRSLCEYELTHRYSGDEWTVRLERMLTMPMALDRSVSSLIFCKRRGNAGGWFYRRPHWTQGPPFVPSFTEPDFQPHSLIEVMDRHSVFPQRWAEWKKEHPNIFPTAQEQQE
jgi:hypothetical protein